MLHATYGHVAHHLGILEADRPQALLPLMEVNSPLTGRRGVSLPFADECRLLCRDRASGERIFREALELGLRRRWKYLEVRGVDVEGWPGSPSVSYVGHEVSLSDGPDAVFAAFDSSVRRAIRKAEGAKVHIRISDTLEAVKTYYFLHCKTRRKHGVPPQSFCFFRNIFEHVLTKGKGFVATAVYEDRPVAAGVFVHTNDKGVFKFGASDEAFLHLRANDLVMWEALKWYASKGYVSFSFGRTARTNEGLQRFKRGFGAHEYSINYFRYDLHKETFVKGRDEAFGWANRAFCLMPVPVSRMLGALAYRHLS